MVLTIIFYGVMCIAFGYLLGFIHAAIIVERSRKEQKDDSSKVPEGEG